MEILNNKQLRFLSPEFKEVGLRDLNFGHFLKPWDRSRVPGD